MLRPLTLILIACLALPAAASAQFGNILKKGKDKAAKEAAKAVGVQPAQPSGELKFDDTMLELTTPVVNQVIAGLKVRANTKDAQGRNSAQVRQKANELYEEANKLNLNRDAERSAYYEKKSAADNCVSEHLSVVKQQQSDALQAKIMGMTGANLQGMNSPNAKFMQELNAAQVEMAAAAQANDTAGMRKAQAKLNKALGIDPKADSAKANAKCNVPPPPPWMARADSLNAESTRLYNQARDLEEKSNTEAIKASGLTAEQFVMGVERVTAYVAGGGSLWKFSKNEDAALKAASGQLKPLVG